MKKLLILMLLVVALVLGLMLWGWKQGISLRDKLERFRSIDQEVRILKLEEKALTRWVYQNSERISIHSAETIVRESMKTNKPLLLLALINAETNFVPTAVSSKGAVGLTQVMFNVHGKLLIERGIIKEKRDLFDLATSIRAGDVILSGYLQQSHGDVAKALERYLGQSNTYYSYKVLSNLANLYVMVNGLGPD